MGSKSMLLSGAKSEHGDLQEGFLVCNEII